MFCFETNRVPGKLFFFFLCERQRNLARGSEGSSQVSEVLGAQSKQGERGWNTVHSWDCEDVSTQLCRGSLPGDSGETFILLGKCCLGVDWVHAIGKHIRVFSKKKLFLRILLFALHVFPIMVLTYREKRIYFCAQCLHMSRPCRLCRDPSVDPRAPVC